MERVALVTGCGSPRGIGQATARRLARERTRVVVSDRPGAGGAGGGGLAALVAAIAADGGAAHALEADLVSRAACATLVEGTVAWGGGLDVLVNCAGTPAGAGPFLAHSTAAWEQSFAVNVTSLFHLAQLALPALIERGGGSIVAIASLAGLGVVEGGAAYHASKFAVVGLAKAIAAEFGRDGVRCNAVCPGMVLTDMGDVECRLVAERQGISIDAARASLAAEAALGRAAGPVEVAEVVAFLCSPAAGYVTGVALPVAGGAPLGL